MNRKKILIVEDEPIIALDLRAVLEATGFLVLEAANEQAALLLADCHLPDLVILNVKSELFDSGMALARLLQARYVLEVLFVTGARNGDMAASPDFDAKYRVLHKPFTRRQLRQFLFPEKIPPFPDSQGIFTE